MHEKRPFLFTNVQTGEGDPKVASWMEHLGRKAPKLSVANMAG
jgi:hypothetical protein